MSRRGKDRRKMTAYPCRDCEAYYKDLPQERVQRSCRHRSEYRPAPPTPPGFWDLDFPSSPEIIASGAMQIDDGSHPLSRRPLNEYGRRRRQMYRRKLSYKDTEVDDDANDNNKKADKTEKDDTNKDKNSNSDL